MASIRETPNGFDVLWRSPEHGRLCRDGCIKTSHERSRRFDSRRDAERFRNAVQSGLDFGLGPSPTVLHKPAPVALERTFKTAALALIARRGPRGSWSPGTCEQYTSALLTKLAPLHSRTVADVANARADVMSLLSSLPRSKTPLFVIRAVCEDALNHGDIAGHRLGDIATDYQERREIIPATRDQLQVIIGALDAWHPGAGLLVWLGDGVGVRAGEALALRVSDFRNDYATVRVQRQWQRGKLRALKAKRPGSYRDVPVSAALAERIRQHVADRGLSAQSPLFAHRGQFYTAPTVGDYFRNGARAAGLPVAPVRPAFTYHQLRHGLASRLLSAGVPISTVAAYLGHSALQTTETYSHLLPDSDAAVRAILDAS